ncbi:MAG TPA: TonB family protein [Puia sp.]|nr:TonB family protein [Puia sp.]
MEIQQIPRADLLDILFDGRNKDYGAYDLRKTYNGRLTKALILTGSVCLVLIGSYTLAGRLDKTHRASPLPVADVILNKVTFREKPAEMPPPPRLKPIVMQQMATLKDFVPRIVKGEVKPEDTPLTQDEMTDVKLGDVTVQGPQDDRVVAPPQNNGLGTGVTVAPVNKNADEEGIVGIVEIEASYPGGLEAWRRFLLKNFHYPEQAIAEDVSGTVIVQFVVDKEGNVSNVEAISGPELLRQEAIRVIKKSGRWEVAIQNGRHVNSYKRQPIVVQLQNE